MVVDGTDRVDYYNFILHVGRKKSFLVSLSTFFIIPFGWPWYVINSLMLSSCIPLDLLSERDL